MAKLNIKAKPKRKRVVKHRRDFTHQRIDKDQRIRTKDYILADNATTLEEAKQKARLLTEGNTRTHIKLENDKYNIYTYFKLNPIRRKRLEQLEKQARDQKTAIAAPEQEPKRQFYCVWHYWASSRFGYGVQPPRARVCQRYS